LRRYGFIGVFGRHSSATMSKHKFHEQEQGRRKKERNAMNKHKFHPQEQVRRKRKKEKGK